MIVMLGMTMGAKAQTKLYHTSLKEAVSLAKSEGKGVIVLGCTTWCGPCKALKKNVLPLPEVGEYINANFIVLSLELDKSDPDNFAKEFNVHAYPTIVFLDSEGKEINRIVGAPGTAEGFMNAVKESLKPTNSWAYHKEQLEKDPASYSEVYFKALQDTYNDEGALKLLEDMMEYRSIEQNFNASKMKFYDKNLRDLSSPLAQYMIANEKAVDALIGEGETSKFIGKKADDIYVGSTMGGKGAKAVTEALSIGDKHKIARTDTYKFVKKNAQNLADKNTAAMIDYAIKLAPKASSGSRSNIYSIIKFSNTELKNDKIADELKPSMKKLLTLLYDLDTKEEKDIAGRYKNELTKLGL